MARELKTKMNNASVEKFIDAVPDEQKRDDSRAIVRLMRTVTKEEPKMWGTAIIGFGTYRYKYTSGQEADWPLAAFSPRKQNLTLYVMPGFETYDDLMSKLGKYKTGKVCIYIKNLRDVDEDILKKLIKGSVDHVKKKHS